MPNVVTIREAVQRAKDDDLPISEYALRQWVKTGAVPVRRIGQKALLFYPNLVKFLQCEDHMSIQATTEAVMPGVRQIGV